MHWQSYRVGVLEIIQQKKKESANNLIENKEIYVCGGGSRILIRSNKMIQEKHTRKIKVLFYSPSPKK